MSVRYFTNNAATGDGSLYQTVLDAQEGDVVAPDPTSFSAGERVEIDFADILKIERPITIDAGKTRLFRIKDAERDWSSVLSESLKNALERERQGFDYLAEMEDKAAEKELQALDDESEKNDDSEYDKLLESQVVTPPAWYIEEVWGRLRLPGIHLPPEMMARYLSLYEKKRNGTRRTYPRTSHFTPPKRI